jgi:hypothetical protein
MAAFDFLLVDREKPAIAPARRVAIAPAQEPVPGGITLDRADRELVNALAAMHLRYGKGEAALALLQLSNRFWPREEQTLRLLTQAFLLIGDYESADMTEIAWRRVASGAQASRGDLLRQAVIHFGLGRLAEARAALAACFARREKDAA